MAALRETPRGSTHLQQKYLALFLALRKAEHAASDLIESTQVYAGGNVPSGIAALRGCLHASLDALARISTHMTLRAFADAIDPVTCAALNWPAILSTNRG